MVNQENTEQIDAIANNVNYYNKNSLVPSKMGLVIEHEINQGHLVT